jgi:DMSO/TMAO reductase YedYZ molybdopterin-dependent catalytic subunit
VRSGWWLSFAGAVAVGAALATGELIAGIVAGVPSPLLAVARFLVDIQPPGAKELMVALFGTADKVAFQVVILVIALGVGAALGRLSARRPDAAAALIVVFVAAGFLASLREPGAVATVAVAAAGVEALIGVWLLRRLVALAPTEAGTAARATAPAGAASMPDWRRRSLLRAGGAIAIGSVAAGTLGRLLLEKQRAPATTGELPPVALPATLPAGADIATADLAAAGMTPIVVPNETFYRIDTAFIVPTVDRATWRLRIHGLVEREVTLTYDELVALPLIDQFVTIACVSNEVGGNLVGNARWTGVPLRTVLEMAGVNGSADQLVGRSVDGFTAGMPVDWVLDESRVPMIAVGMNGEPLPRVHGYPARLIVPGLYGYVSATKWLTELELTRFDQFEAFWVPRGWAAKAPILTQSRIDVPRAGAGVSAGRVPVAGVAWAPDRGIGAVEVRVDEGPWAPARLSTPIAKATWVQWRYDWEATPGEHAIEVRATDGTGEVQTESRSAPAPDGARGHHRIQVQVG